MRGHLAVIKTTEKPAFLMRGGKIFRDHRAGCSSSIVLGWHRDRRRSPTAGRCRPGRLRSVSPAIVGPGARGTACHSSLMLTPRSLPDRRHCGSKTPATAPIQTLLAGRSPSTRKSHRSPTRHRDASAEERTSNMQRQHPRQSSAALLLERRQYGRYVAWAKPKPVGECALLDKGPFHNCEGSRDPDRHLSGAIAGSSEDRLADACAPTARSPADRFEASDYSPHLCSGDVPEFRP